MKKKYISKEYKSPIGSITVISTDKGVKDVLIDSLDIPEGTPGDPFGALRQMEDYFNGRLTEFSLPLDIAVSDFDRKVLSETMNIPYGKTATYGEIARLIGNPKAFRAVGGTLGRNPAPIIIPCHRVLGKQSLGGYAFGLGVKKALLGMEGVKL